MSGTRKDAGPSNPFEWPEPTDEPPLVFVSEVPAGSGREVTELPDAEEDTTEVTEPGPLRGRAGRP